MKGHGAATLRQAATPAGGPAWLSRRLGWQYALWCAAGLALLGLFGRILAYPLRHDEQMYLPAGILFSPSAIYAEHGFNHLPNLPILLGMIFTVAGPGQYLLTGRLVICAAWVAIGLALWLMAKRATARGWIGGLAFLLLATNGIYLGQAGMLVSNNLLPVPFALFALHVYIGAVDRPQPDPARVVLAGVLAAIAVGLKANYVFVVPPFVLAALLSPAAIGFGVRLRRIVLPLALGGIVGGLPTLWFLATDRDGFLAHVVRYHTGPHAAWAAANTEALVRSPGDKLLLAEQLWLSGSALLILAGLALVAAIMARNGVRQALARLGRWPLLLTAALMAGGGIVSFIPTPSFPQYFLPPLAFGAVLLILLIGELDRTEAAVIVPLGIALTVLATIIGGPRLFAGLPSAVSPDRWTGNRTAALGAEIARHIPATGIPATGIPATGIPATRRPARVATLSPIYALEAGLGVYPELAAGPFVYRVAALIPAADRRHYRLLSPASLQRRFDADPPAAILTGLEGGLDAGLVAYARSRGYRRVPLAGAMTRDGELMLHVRPTAR